MHPTFKKQIETHRENVEQQTEIEKQAIEISHQKWLDDLAHLKLADADSNLNQSDLNVAGVKRLISDLKVTNEGLKLKLADIQGQYTAYRGL